ncbi:MAG: hypothetical protein UU09_C0014G0010 [Microgenomates group bacterium GW2011_GWA2_40_6]|nr:MAG: hypothetical protein UU09_C0014G0010 [Microgenomates group bacterium GW2011_GWA2_40_6]
MAVKILTVESEIVGFIVPPGTNCLSCRVPHAGPQGICVIPLAGGERALDLSRVDGEEDASNCRVITTVRSSG